MKHDYQRKIQHLNDVIKEQEDIIKKLQKGKYSSQDTLTRLQATDEPNNYSTGPKNSWIKFVKYCNIIKLILRSSIIDWTLKLIFNQSRNKHLIME